MIYDAAHCFGINYKGESILNWGDISTLSFHATKLFHTGEGGAVVCNNDELAHKIFYSHNFGHDGPEAFFGLGINGKVSELNAAMGLAVLPHLDEIIADRRKTSQLYDSSAKRANLRKPTMREEIEYNYIYYPVVFPTEACLLKTKEELNRNEIFPRRYFYPSLNNLPYVEKQEVAVSEEISRTILCLPLYAGMNETDVCRIGEIIRDNLK